MIRLEFIEYCNSSAGFQRPQCGLQTGMCIGHYAEDEIQDGSVKGSFVHEQGLGIALDQFNHSRTTVELKVGFSEHVSAEVNAGCAYTGAEEGRSAPVPTPTSKTFSPRFKSSNSIARSRPAGKR